MKKRKNRSDETLLCIAFSKHCHHYFPQTRGKFVWSHIPLRGKSEQEGSLNKKMGVHAGLFDYLFIAHPSDWKVICLEAKVHGTVYSDTQNTFDYMTTGMPVYKAKFYTVQEGHNQLMAAGVTPRYPCTHFKEPVYASFRDKLNAVHDFMKP